MEYLPAIAWTIVFTISFLAIYKFVINPQVVLTIDTNKMSKCPDGWNYNLSTSLCEPQMKTSCYPFNPNVQTMQTPAARCNLARTCGTTWSGMCG
jgi:hypothetical protein